MQVLLESRSLDEEEEATPEEVVLLLGEEVVLTEGPGELQEAEEASVEVREAHHEVAVAAAPLEGEAARAFREEPIRLPEAVAGTSQRSAAWGEISLQGVLEYPGTVPDAWGLMDV